MRSRTLEADFWNQDIVTRRGGARRLDARRGGARRLDARRGVARRLDARRGGTRRLDVLRGGARRLDARRSFTIFTTVGEVVGEVMRWGGR